MTPRLPTPDIARGFMLLLIALANVAAWFPAADLAASGTLDRAWVFIRTLFIDARSYPLFSMLFGFGLATVAARYENPDDAGRVLRRRGWWLVAFGLVHAILFPGDVLGAYGLVAVALSGLIAARRRNALIITAVLVGTLSTAMYVAASLTFEDPVTQGAQGVQAAQTMHADTDGMPDFVTMSLPAKLALWLAGTIGGATLTAVLPCVVIGVFLHHSGILTAPWRHRRRLALTATGGLALTALLGLPAAFAELEAFVSVGTDALHALGSYPGGLGWLALIAWVTARPRRPIPETAPTDTAIPDTHAPGTSAAGTEVTSPEVSPPTLPASTGATASALAAIGKRSLTAYLSQTFLFAPLFAVLHSLGVRDGLTPTGGAGIAVLVWLLTGLFCVALERRGKRGPFEVLNRLLSYGKPPQVTASSDAAA